MKRIICYLCLFGLVLLLTSCGQKEKVLTATEEPSINADRYDEKRLQTAYYEAVCSRVPLEYEEDGAHYFRDELQVDYEWDDKVVLEKRLKHMQYCYIDCDGDGIPELVIDGTETDNSFYILTYHPEEDRVKIGDTSGNFLYKIEQVPKMLSFSEAFVKASKEKMVSDKAVQEVYEEFLCGDREAENISMDKIIAVKKEKDIKKERVNESIIRYTICDVTGDGIPELHIQTEYDYYILKYEKEDLFVWDTCLNLDEREHYSVLHEGNILYQAMKTDWESYCCYQVEESAHYTGTIWLKRKDSNRNGSYDKEDYYRVNANVCTAEEWKAKAGEYLVMDEAYRILGVKNQVEWTVYGEGR